MPTRPSKKQRAVATLAKRQWHFLSFANGEGFMGACIVEGYGDASARRRARALKIHPSGHGEVMVIPLDANDMKRIAPDLCNRLLTEAEVRARLDGKRVSE